MLVLHSCPTLLILCSPPGSSVHGILQARILEWVAISVFQGVFPTHGSNPSLPHFRKIPYHLSHQGSFQGGFFSLMEATMCWHLTFPLCPDLRGRPHRVLVWRRGYPFSCPSPSSQFAVEVIFPLPAIDLPGGFSFDHNTAQGPWVPLSCKLMVETLGGTE